jgi:DNA/RNA-binding domain of Phe-tRNA-synthetase-like protein
MIKLVVHKDAYELGIRNPIACLIKNIAVAPELCHTLTEDVQDMMNFVQKYPERILARAEVQGFSTLLKKLGYPDQTPAGKRLFESFQRRGFKSYNNIVDSYNVASVLFGSGLGLHDAVNIIDDIHIYCAEGNESIKPLFTENSQEITKGDLIYAFGGNALAWLGKKDVDSEDYKVTYDTRHLLLIALGNENTSVEYNRDACLTAIRLMRKSCPKIYSRFIQTIVK